MFVQRKLNKILSIKYFVLESSLLQLILDDLQWYPEGYATKCK